MKKTIIISAVIISLGLTTSAMAESLEHADKKVAKAADKTLNAAISEVVTTDIAVDKAVNNIGKAYNKEAKKIDKAEQKSAKKIEKVINKEVKKLEKVEEKYAKKM